MTMTEEKYPLYKRVYVMPAKSQFGSHVVKISDVTSRWFWNVKSAHEFADKHNERMAVKK